ncbi:MAG TPA: protein kinase [Labilithrix sp.]
MAARDLAVPSSRRKSGDGESSGERPRPSPALEAKYRSLLVVGKGGMGTVEAALDVAHGDRIVALKRLLPDSARDARRVEMFLREARLATMLDHRNVVRAYDYGEVEGELFLAMEYVEGQSLARVLKAVAKPLPPSLVAFVLAEVCDGLHAAHELTGEDGQPLHLVHRDVSPQNVMIGHDGHVRLLDFGVAKIEAESVTKTGEVKGKTAYMSPEQAMGEAIDRRSDLFGVGAVLYECLTSKRMWGDGTDMEVIRKLALEEPPPLDGPPPLKTLYERLVARDAKARPATAREVAEALRAACPEGREEATRALKVLLDETFGDAIAEQRRRLEVALDDTVAPDKARELRESIAPSSARDASDTSAVRRSDPGARASISDPPGVAWGRYAVLAGAAIVVGIVAWRLSPSIPEKDKGPPASSSHTAPDVTPTRSAPSAPSSDEIPAVSPSDSHTAPSPSVSGSHTPPDVKPPSHSGGGRVLAQPKPAGSGSVASPPSAASHPPPVHSARPIDEDPL